MKKLFAIISLFIPVALIMAACSSSPVAEPQARDVSFPAVDSAWIRGGTYPNLDNVRLLRQGMTKDQVAALIGRPHYSWGDFNAWDYVLQLSETKDSKVTTCQLHIVFGDKTLTQGLYWKPEQCANFMKVPEPPAAPAPVVIEKQTPVVQVVEKTTPPVHTFVLKSDSTFLFGKGDLAGLQAQGRKQIIDLAQGVVRGSAQTHVNVIAYTDRIGTQQGNLKLSQQRAETVRSLMISQGVPANMITAEGRGSDNPLVTCNDKNRQKLIKCLAPNRRVEVLTTEQR